MPFRKDSALAVSPNDLRLILEFYSVVLNVLSVLRGKQKSRVPTENVGKNLFARVLYLNRKSYALAVESVGCGEQKIEGKKLSRLFA